MRPRPFEQGYLAVLAKHSAGRRPAVSSARVWRGSSVLAACGGASDDSKWASVEPCRTLLIEYQRSPNFMFSPRLTRLCAAPVLAWAA